MTTYTARTPVDLLAVVPFVIGFHPEDSVVMLTFADPGSDDSSFHARVDLPLVEAGQRQVATLLRDVAGRHRARMVGLVLYTDDIEAAVLFADLLVPWLLVDGIDVIDVIRVDGDRFFAVDDPDDPGTRFDLTAHPFTAGQVLEGRVAHESRAALRDTLVGTDDNDAGEVDAAARAVVDRLVDSAGHDGGLTEVMVAEARWVQGAVRSALRRNRQLPVEDAARLLVLVSFEALREVVWSAMDRGTAREHVELWRDLLRRAPADLRPGVGGLLGFAAWLSGEGALAWCAVERCFEADPDDQLGQHVADLLESATPPTVWSPAPAGALRIFRSESGAVES